MIPAPTQFYRLGHLSHSSGAPVLSPLLLLLIPPTSCLALHCSSLFSICLLLPGLQFLRSMMPFSFSCLLPLGVCGLWFFPPKYSLWLKFEISTGRELVFSLNHHQPRHTEYSQQVVLSASGQPTDQFQFPPLTYQQRWALGYEGWLLQKECCKGL